jgi:hypothetical protein
MKYLPLLIFLFLLSCNPGYKPHKILIENDIIEVQFGRMMSKTLLDSIAMVLELKSVHLTFPVIKYDGNKLNELEFIISDGIHTGTAKTHFVNNNKPFGFRVDKNTGTLKVGELN